MIGEIVAAGCSLVFLAVSRHRHKEELARIAADSAPPPPDGEQRFEMDQAYRRGQKEGLTRAADMAEASGYRTIAETIRANI